MVLTDRRMEAVLAVVIRFGFEITAERIEKGSAVMKFIKTCVKTITVNC